MLIRCCLWLALAGIVARAQESALVRIGEPWRYFKGVREPSAPAGAWRLPEFDDAGWATGISGFSWGYGSEYDEPTRLPDYPLNYWSLYVRKTFAVTNPAALHWLTLRIDYNDGFAAYLNGIEVARRNLPGHPGDPVPFNALAPSLRARGQTEEINLTPHRGLLREGTNVLAIQVHGAGGLDRTLALMPELLGNFLRGPFIQNTTSNSTQVIWKTPVPTRATVEYGPTADLGLSVSSDAPATTHALTLAGLTPGTLYHYRAISEGQDARVISETASFRTLKTAGSVRFAVLGDSGTGSHAQYAVADQMSRANPDLVLHTGDVIYPQFTTNLADARCLSVYHPHMKSTPYFFSIGNHDLYAGDFPYLDAFFLPTNQVTGTEHFYSFDHGDVHFAVLLQPYVSQYLLTPGDFQYQWLTNDLATTRQPWKVLIMHVPMMTSGIHRFDDYGKFGTPDRFDIMDTLLPVAAEHGVQLVFAGHDHQYERFMPTNGVHTIITAGGGIELRWLLQLDELSSRFELQHHFMNVEVEGDTLRVQAINTRGEAFDGMTIRRALPEPARHASTWHSASATTNAANDMDGNVNGETFNLIGEPILPRAGRFSNLGRVFVNNDRTNLFVGFDQTMIHRTQDILLFMEGPGGGGVSSLAEVGNGRVDPDEQGADALDFAANLAFTNFLPSIGVILGDEFGDFTSASFGRFHTRLRGGQGAFRLGAELTPVPGTRLNQFNQSPQTGGFPGEENANFIQLSIPLSALGVTRAGQTIKLAAIVGLAAVRTNLDQQTREFDTSALALAMQGSGFDPVAIEGVPVRLALDPLGDEDGDGLPNAEEERAGTDPFQADSDQDGLPDGWEVAHRLNPLSGAGHDGPEGDPDGDGFSNAREFQNGTDPRDARSGVRLRVERVAAQRWRFSWSSLAGRRYQLESTDNLRTPFLPLNEFIPPRMASSTNEVFEMDPSGTGAMEGAARFFRVRVAGP